MGYLGSSREVLHGERPCASGYPRSKGRPVPPSVLRGREWLFDSATQGLSTGVANLQNWVMIDTVLIVVALLLLVAVMMRKK